MSIYQVFFCSQDHENRGYTYNAERGLTLFSVTFSLLLFAIFYDRGLISSPHSIGTKDTCFCFHHSCCPNTAHRLNQQICKTRRFKKRNECEIFIFISCVVKFWLNYLIIQTFPRINFVLKILRWPRLDSVTYHLYMNYHDEKKIGRRPKICTIHLDTFLKMKDSTVNYEFRFLTRILRIYAHIRS